ncbi:peptidase S24-like protein [bacterium BMS3Abin06]|nr:peptidase S24-like protein [bacterium BMS3Abin06]
MSGDTCKTIVCVGSSMNPALKASDILHVLPCNGKKIQCGDVIVFPSPESNRMVVHRVISVDATGIRTQGDRSRYIDPWILRPESIVGRVIRAQRGNRQRLIYGGVRGRLYSSGIRAIRMIDLKISSLLHPLYHRLAQTHVLRRWLPAWMQTRVLCFDRPAGTEFHLIMGRRVIGRLMPGRSQWAIQRPFRLFVNEASLPSASRTPGHR